MNRSNSLLLSLPILLLLFLGISAAAQSTNSSSAQSGYVGTALLIGNSDYENATQLTSPANDARDMGKTLRQLGFKVLTVRADSTLEEMDKAIVEFGRELSNRGGVGLFYYSGHGVQSNGKNYLIPVDADIPSENFLKSRSIDVEIVLETMAKTTSGFKIVILDACRNNPFAKSWGFKSSAGGGLAGIYSAPKGMLIAYATSPNNIAADGPARNSLYTEVLLKEMVKPGIKISDVFDRVREILDERTNGGQIPWESTSLIGKFCLAGCSSDTRGQNSASAATSISVESRAEASSTQTQSQSINRTSSQTQSQTQISDGSGTQRQAQRQSQVDGNRTQRQSQTQSAGAPIDTWDPDIEDLPVITVTIKYGEQDTLRIGSGPQEFITKWASCGKTCVYAFSEELESIANSRVSDFDEVGDFTAYDRSSRVREILLNQILVVKNSSNYYALVQVLKISYDDRQIIVRYKIIPERRKSTWKPHPEKFISRGLSGRIRFAYEDNNKSYVIGSGNKSFDLRFGGFRKGGVRLYNYNGISLIAVVSGASGIDPDLAHMPRTKSEKIRKNDEIADLEIGDQIVIANKNGTRAIIRIIDAKTSNYSSEVDEVTFEYQIID